MRYLVMFLSMVLTPVLWMCYYDVRAVQRRVLHERIEYFVKWRTRRCTIR